jgi:hypothetical protein
MVKGRRARVADPSAVVDPAVFDAVDGLLSDGVLREDVQGRQHGVSPVIFSHPVLFDFAVAVTCLHGEDPLHLKQRLDSDPDLVITIRPSLDMYFTDLWSDTMDRSRFWKLVLALSTRDRGHPIAAVAAASVVLRQHPGIEDILFLQEQALLQGPPGQTARTCINFLAAAFDATEISPGDRRACAPALAGLAEGLAAKAAATGDVGLGDLARLILFRLDRTFPLTPDAVAAEPRSRATADVMRCALTNPSSRASETLAERIAGPLAGAVAVDPDNVAPVIDAVIQLPAMAAWGGQVANFIIARTVFTDVDPKFAERLMTAVWQFNERRDEKTPIGSSAINPLTSTRQQDLEQARYETGERFPDFLAASPETALEFFASIIGTHASTYESPRKTGQNPHVYQGQDLRYAGHGAIDKMTSSLMAFLVSSAESADARTQAVADQLIQMTAARVTHHEFWNHLLETAAAHPDSLGPMVLALLDGSELLGHPMTMAFAAQLTAALSGSLPPQEHGSLEQFIFRAHNPFNPGADDAQELADMLLGQLDRGRIQDPASRARLAELDAIGGPPAAPQPLSTDASFGRTFPNEGNSAPDTTRDAVQRALEQVSSDINGVRAAIPEGREAARHRLHASVPLLYDILMAGNGAAGVAAFGEAFAVLVLSAQILSADPDVIPDSEIGQMVLGILRAGLPAKPSSTGNS